MGRARKTKDHQVRSGGRNLRLPVRGGVALAAALLGGTTAGAQTAQERGDGYFGLEEITVTAQRRAQPIQEVPIAVTAFTQNHLERAGITNTQELALVTPGLTFASVGGYGQPRIRGIGTGANAPSLENPVATYVDGVYYAHQIGSVFAFNNIEQIEVLKGPQGTLFGRNATGGLIQITTRKPTQEFQGEVSLGYGNYETITSNLYVSGGVAANLAADIAVHFQDQGDGYGVNLATGQEINKMRNFAARSKWVLTPSDSTEFTFIIDYGRDIGALVQAPAPGTTPLGGGVFMGQDVNIPSPLRNRNEHGGASLRLQHDFGGVELISTTAFRKSDGTIFFPNATSDPASLTLVSLFDKFEQYSQEFQIQSPAEDRIHWTAGAFFYYAKGGWQPVNLTGGGLFPLNSIDISDTQKTYSGSAYAQATAEIFTGTSLTAGLRFTADEKKWRGDQVFDAPFPIPSFGDSAKDNFKKVTWRLALDHKLGDDSLIYVSANRGFKSGGFNDSIVPAALYKPEVLDAYELGFKTETLNNRLRFNTAAFFYDYKNIQVSRYQGGNIVIYNGAGAEVYGLDFDVQASVTANFVITAGLSFMDSKYTSFPNADLTTPLPGGGTNMGVGDAKGNKLSYAPDWTLNLAADYTIPTETGDVTLNATWYYNDGWYANPDNRLRQPSYHTVNASVSWTSPDEAWRVMAWAKNLFDEEYAIYLSAQANGDSTQLAAPRTYGIDIKRKF